MWFITENPFLHRVLVRRPVALAGKLVRSVWLEVIGQTLAMIQISAIQWVSQFLRAAVAVFVALARVRVEVFRAGPALVIFRFVRIVLEAPRVPDAHQHDARARA